MKQDRQAEPEEQERQAELVVLVQREEQVAPAQPEEQERQAELVELV